MDRSVLCDVQDGIATVTLNRPPVNAIDLATVDELRETFVRLSADEAIRVVILTGAGSRAFCAGNDLRDANSPAASGRRPSLDRGRQARELFWAIRDCAVPVIGAINGAALGSGLAMASMCDVLIASETASFGLPEINVGLLGGGTHMKRLVGVYKMRLAYFTGRRLPAEELYRLGAVEKVVPPEELMGEALALAREIAGKSPIAVRLAKESLNRAEDLELKEAYRTEQDYTLRLMQFEDSREAAQAFLEGRAPRFKFR
jgi:enoyl-CoA hydratase